MAEIDGRVAVRVGSTECAVVHASKTEDGPMWYVADVGGFPNLPDALWAAFEWATQHEALRTGVIIEGNCPSCGEENVVFSSDGAGAFKCPVCHAEGITAYDVRTWRADQVSHPQRKEV